MANDNGWSKSEEFVRGQLDHNATSIERLEVKVEELRLEVAKMCTKLNGFVVIATLIASAIASIVTTVVAQAFTKGG